MISPFSPFLRLMLSSFLFVLAASSAADDSFKKHPRTFNVGPNPTAIVAADLNDDGLPEILTANTGAMSDPRQERPANDEVSALVARGNLEYEALPPLRTDFAPYCLVVGNVDALKAPDILVGCFMAVHHSDLWLFRNMSENLFESLSYRVPEEKLAYKRMYNSDNEPVFTVPGIATLVLCDANRDGYRDVVAAGWSSDVLIYFPGVPDKYFGDPRFIPAPGAPRDLDAADLDGDGNLDLAVALYAANEVGVWKGNGEGAFEPATRFSSRGRLPSKIQIADVNRDGKLDIVVSHCHTDDAIAIFYGEGGFKFSVSQEIVLGKDRGALDCEIRDLVVTDLNGDKKPDIAAACATSREVAVLINDSSDASVPQSFRREGYRFEDAQPRALSVADLDKDGVMDIAVALGDTNTVTFLIGQGSKAEGAGKR